MASKFPKARIHGKKDEKLMRLDVDYKPTSTYTIDTYSVHFPQQVKRVIYYSLEDSIHTAKHLDAQARDYLKSDAFSKYGQALERWDVEYERYFESLYTGQFTGSSREDCLEEMKLLVEGVKGAPAITAPDFPLEGDTLSQSIKDIICVSVVERNQYLLLYACNKKVVDESKESHTYDYLIRTTPTHYSAMFIAEPHGRDIITIAVEKSAMLPLIVRYGRDEDSNYAFDGTERKINSRYYQVILPPGTIKRMDDTIVLSLVGNKGHIFNPLYLFTPTESQ